MTSAFENRLRRAIEMAGTDGQAGPVPVMAIPSGRVLTGGTNAVMPTNGLLKLRYLTGAWREQSRNF